MATFLLIHGAYHQGAHFDLLTSALRERGHDAVAPDLPATDRHAGAAQYARHAAAAVAHTPGGASDVVVVGHSMGGLTAPVVATLIPVRRIVYLAAFVPQPGRSFDDVSWHDTRINAPHAAQTYPLASDDGSASVPLARATEVFFHDCWWERARWAWALLRPQQWRVLQEPCPLDQMPEVESAFIACRSDRVVNPAWVQAVARERFQQTAIMIDGGHSPFISRPAELAGILTGLT